MLVEVLLASLLLGAAAAPPPPTGNTGGSSDIPPPVVLAGARSVSTRDDNGGFQRDTSIPSASAFATFAGGKTATCTVVADRDNFQLSNGTRAAENTVITSNYVFIEGNPVGPKPTTTGTSQGPLENAIRVFTAYCDSARYPINIKSVILVPLLDPFLNPRPNIDTLRQTLHLDRPTLFTNPIINTYGGLVTRYPTWLAIHPNAWRTQLSDPTFYKGTTLHLIAEPYELNFTINFTPKPGTTTHPYHSDINCIPELPAQPDDQALPAFPVLPDQTEPGPNGPCMWTPPGPGTATITATITYTITFWADGYTEPDNDYTWNSTPTTYNTGELNAVNTKP